MTNEEKELLLKDLCARVPYKTRVSYTFAFIRATSISGYSDEGILSYDKLQDFSLPNVGYENRRVVNILPYLRPMSSMTHDESCEMFKTIYNHKVTVLDIEQDRIRYGCIQDGSYGHIVLFFNKIYSIEQIDWLNAHHFDYRGLIEKGLALEAPEGMYKS